MLTNKGKYGLKALVDLAGLEPGQTAFVTDIATRNNIPKKFLDTILLSCATTASCVRRRARMRLCAVKACG